MEERLNELTVRRLVERLATSDPVPGGGSAAALAGAMGAALVHMVVELTAGRPSAEGSEGALAEISAAATNCSPSCSTSRRWMRTRTPRSSPHAVFPGNPSASAKRATCRLRLPCARRLVLRS